METFTPSFKISSLSTTVPGTVLGSEYTVSGKLAANRKYKFKTILQGKTNAIGTEGRNDQHNVVKVIKE